MQIGGKRLGTTLLCADVLAATALGAAPAVGSAMRRRQKVTAQISYAA